MSLSHDYAAEVNAGIIDNLRAENARLQDEVKEMPGWADHLRWKIDEAKVRDLLRERDRLQEQVERYNRRIIELLEETLELRALAKVRGEALEPFADIASQFEDEDDAFPVDCVSLDECRQARDAIAMTPEEARA